MSLFAKDLDYLEVSAADFLPDDNKLFIVVADSECNLYILQYDPEGRRPRGHTAGKTPMVFF
jgi:cleavage and polyadenylation specificity factor subunit 1